MKYLSKFLFVFMFTITINSFSKEIYVSKDGNDTNDGTKENPYLTITKAASVAIAGDIVFIREGTYEETLAPANSGTAGNPIIFQSYPGERVIISAMEALSGWTQANGSIYKTTISFSSLGQENFVMNGETALDLARWPNKTEKDPFALGTIRNTGGSAPEVSTGAYLIENSIPAFDWTGGTVFFYGDKPGSGWIAWKETITSSTSGRVNFNLNKSPDWIRTFHAPGDLGDFYLEGVKDALDYKNEWWFDKSSKELFVQLPNGSAPVDGVVKMRRRKETINLKDKSYIQIKNLAVFGGSINMEDSSTWQVGGNNKTTNNLLYGISSFYGNHTLGVFSGFNAGKPSVKIQGSYNTVEKCEIAFSAATGLDVRGNYHKIEDSRIHDFNYLGSYDAPLVVRGIFNTTVKNNEIFNGGRDGINYNGENNEIAFNDVSRSNLIADDCALFYTVGKQLNTEIHHNWFHDVASSGDKKKAAGIYLDNNPEGFVVHHNVVWNTEWSSIQMNWSAKDIEIYNNTLWNGSTVMGAWHKEGTEFSNVKVWNNLGSDNEWEPESDKQNNLTENKSVFRNSDDGDFYLNAGSNPIDQGKIITGITDGFVGTAPDVGAYEHGGDEWVPGISWDYKYGPTGQGCYGLPGEDCINLPAQDEDKDGVADEYDECPGTPLGTEVNGVGCPFFSLPADNFTVMSKGEPCPNSNSGSISITSQDTSLSFTAELVESGEKKDFDSNVEFNDLAGGVYNICITTSEDDAYKQCFEITVDAPAALKVSSKVDKYNKQVSLQLNGSKTYRITLNGITKLVNTNEVILDLQAGENQLKVTTDKECQGVYNESFQLLDTILIYPNSVSNFVNISFPNALNEIANIQVVSVSGQVIIQLNKNINIQKANIDLSELSSGLYFIKISSPSINFQSKIIKQ